MFPGELGSAERAGPHSSEPHRCHQGPGAAGLGSGRNGGTGAESAEALPREDVTVCRRGRPEPTVPADPDGRPPTALLSSSEFRCSRVPCPVNLGSPNPNKGRLGVGGRGGVTEPRWWFRHKISDTAAESREHGEETPAPPPSQAGAARTGWGPPRAEAPPPRAALSRGGSTGWARSVPHPPAPAGMTLSTDRESTPSTAGCGPRNPGGRNTSGNRARGAGQGRGVGAEAQRGVGGGQGRGQMGTPGGLPTPPCPSDRDSGLRTPRGHVSTQ